MLNKIKFSHVWKLRFWKAIFHRHKLKKTKKKTETAPLTSEKIKRCTT